MAALSALSLEEPGVRFTLSCKLLFATLLVDEVFFIFDPVTGLLPKPLLLLPLAFGIENGASGEWQMPWHQGASIARPSNIATGRRYSGINVVALCRHNGQRHCTPLRLSLRQRPEPYPERS